MWRRVPLGQVWEYIQNMPKIWASEWLDNMGPRSVSTGMMSEDYSSSVVRDLETVAEHGHRPDPEPKSWTIQELMNG